MAGLGRPEVGGRRAAVADARAYHDDGEQAGHLGVPPEPGRDEKVVHEHEAEGQDSEAQKLEHDGHLTRQKGGTRGWVRRCTMRDWGGRTMRDGECSSSSWTRRTYPLRPLQVGVGWRLKEGQGEVDHNRGGHRLFEPGAVEKVVHPNKPSRAMPMHGSAPRCVNT